MYKQIKVDDEICSGETAQKVGNHLYVCVVVFSVLFCVRVTTKYPFGDRITRP